MTNIIIIFGLILLAYLSYTQYLDKKIKTNSNSTPAPSEIMPEPAATTSAGSLFKNESPAPATTQKPSPAATPALETSPSTPLASQPGHYYNSTYAYEIDFPPAWPIKIRSADNISFGSVPPKDGQGAITIEVTTGETSNEIEEAKAEAAKYPGLVSFTEESITLAGASGTKLILNNLLSKTKNIYILLIKNGFNYIIKYSEESKQFSQEAEQAIATFKFIP